MNKKECIKILTAFRSWRRGEGEISAMPSAHEIGLAIDYAIHLLKQKPEKE